MLHLLAPSRRVVMMFLAFCLPALALLTLGGYLFADAEVHHGREQMAIADRDTAQLATQALRMGVRGITQDVKFLADMPDLRRLVNAPDAIGLERVGTVFAAYMNAHGTFDQVRWVDQRGMERLRLNFVDGRAWRVPDQQLQDKSSRPYFTHAARLPKQGIYVSPFDLNIEHGLIEKPFKPMIRFAVPLFDDRGGRQGILVVNYLGKDLLDAFSLAAGKNSDRLMLLDREGYWLQSPVREDEWGFMLDAKSSLELRHPRVWAAVRAAEGGQELVDGELWTWSNVAPLAGIRADLPAAAGNPAMVDGEGEYLWRVAMRLPAQALAAVEQRVWSSVGPVIAVLAVAILVLSARAARSRAHIEHLNRELAARAEVAEQASKAKAAFLANMSHEIRTPMNAILGLAYLLERARLPDSAVDMVRKIRNAGRTLQGIINDILDYSKIEAGRLELEHAPFRLDEVLDNLATIMSTNAREKDLELVITPPGPNANALQGDALRLGQVLINLTSNAIKFTERGHVDVNITRLSEEPDHVTLRFSVRDTGIGIDEDKRREIFAPFGQADASTTRRFGGTGLGLSISRQLVNLMGGELQMRSEPGKGSEFWFVLTLARGREIPDPHRSMLNLPVLVADDNPIALEALRITASSLGWPVATVDSGEAAVKRAMAQRVQGGPSEVIILDWKMPGMDGLSAARAIHETWVGEREPILIMVTAHAREDLIASPDSHVVDAVLSKPVTASALYDAVARSRLARRGAVADAPSTPSNEERLAGLRMLVVDDSDINREVAREIFASEGASVSLADDGQHAVDWLKQHADAVDIVLMDVQMPVMDGYEATRTIRHQLGLERLPIVALTAGAFREQQEAAERAGMNGFIAKPFDVDNAVSLIRHLSGWDAKPTPIPATGSGAGATDPEGLPGLNLKRGLALWKKPAMYQHYLQKFAQEHSDSGRLLVELDRAAASALAHKMKGAAGSLALEEVCAQAGEAEALLRTGGDISAVIVRFQQALEQALASIGRYAHAEDAPADPVDPASIPGELAPLLARVLRALDTDSPDAVHPALAELARHLPAHRLAPLRGAIDDFDFRAAEERVRILAGELDIKLGA